MPVQIIKNIIGDQAILAYNKGTPGPERKITALGILKNQKIFLKFGQTEITRLNVINECLVLQQLSHLDFVPKVLNNWSTNQYELLMTTVLEGERFPESLLNEKIVNLLLDIIHLDIKPIINFQADNQSGFAHGDFCPWNLMVYNNKIQVFDWEMAGNYPLGYDMFTYLFQTSLLLHPKIGISKILQENRRYIDYYFKKLNIKHWSVFLKAFASIKLELEETKQNNRLAPHYIKLLKYASKA